MFAALLILTLVVFPAAFFRYRGAKLTIAGLKLDLEIAREDVRSWVRSFEVVSEAFFDKHNEAIEANANSVMHARLRRRAEERATILRGTMDAYETFFEKFRSRVPNMDRAEGRDAEGKTFRLVEVKPRRALTRTTRTKRAGKAS